MQRQSGPFPKLVVSVIEKKFHDILRWLFLKIDEGLVQQQHVVVSHQ